MICSQTIVEYDETMPQFHGSERTLIAGHIFSSKEAELALSIFKEDQCLDEGVSGDNNRIKRIKKEYLTRAARNYSLLHVQGSTDDETCAPRRKRRLQMIKANKIRL